MTVYFDQEKDPTDDDYYEFEVDATWLGTDTITSATVVPDPGSGLSLNNLGINSNIIRVQLSGGNPGTHGIVVTAYTSTGRVRQRTAYLVVREL